MRFKRYEKNCVWDVARWEFPKSAPPTSDANATGFVNKRYSYGRNQMFLRNAKWAMGRFLMYHGTIYALRRTPGLQRS